MVTIAENNNVGGTMVKIATGSPVSENRSEVLIVGVAK